MEDVIPAMLDAADSVAMSRDDRAVARHMRQLWEQGAGVDPAEIRDEMESLLDAYTPPFTYFGSIDGDGACIGVWVDSDAIESAVSSGDIWREGRGEPDPLYEWRLVVSDHGNMTLFTRRGACLWSVV